jgi:hypothetical protein
MAAPNIVNVATINGRTTYLTPSATTNVVLLTNTASSGKVLKINTLIATNVDGTNSVNVTVSLYTNGAVAQGSAPSGGTAYPLIYLVSVPAGSALSLLDKSVYLEENMSVIVTSGTASKINYTISYDDIS